MRLTEDAFRALARSSPWRWRTLHFTFEQDHRTVVARLRRPGQLLVRRPGHRDFRVDERKQVVPPARWPHEVEPALRPDGLVAERPSDGAVEYDDPMYQSYDWVAMLDPVELSHHTTVADLREELRLGRRTWWARMQPEEGYEPRCGCCPLLWSFISDRDEEADESDAATWRPEEGTVYPQAYDVALDVQTGVAVEVSPVGPSSIPAGHRVELLDVDGDPSFHW